MAKPKRSTRNQPSGRTRNPACTEATSPAQNRLFPALIWGLFLARWLTPTEGTAEGDTLWLTSMTLAAAAGFFWWHSRVSFERLRFQKLDISVWLLCGAHIFSSLVVILTEGNKRAATNMLWEWLAVAVTFTLLRQTITQDSRPKFLRAVLAVTTAIACYGIWQPTFWYPSNLKEYQELKAEIESVESSPDLSSEERFKRQRELRAEFVSRGIPLSGPSQQLFERRLRDSKEPLGFFALTNTFASFMAVGLVLLAGTIGGLLLPDQMKHASSKTVRSNNRNGMAVLGTALLLVTYCLVLTKSRSAWGGSIVGVSVLLGLVVMKSKSGASLKKLIPIVVVGAVVLSLLAGIAIATGALDIEVLTEMSKSLSYRLEYWTSTWDVILDHPLFGTGPGNFRDSYLRHKLPESSEEIADPHQFVLDVTANAGVVGLVGLLSFLAVIGLLSWKLCRQAETTSTTDSTSVNNSIVAWQPSVRTAIGCAAAVAFAGEWLFSGNLGWSVLCVCFVAAMIDRVLTMALSPSSGSAENQNELRVPSVAVVAAVVALFVHLSAAGGIAMPAVIGIALAMAAVLNVDATKFSITDSISKLPNEQPSATGDTDAASGEHFQTGPWLAAALASGLAAVGCTTTAFSPVIRATSLQQLGDYDAINGQPARTVVSSYRSAAAADTLTPEPYLRLSQFYLHQWKQTRDDAFFDQSIEAAERARSLSPHSPHATHEIGYAWLVRASGTSPKDQNAVNAAVEELQKALEMYPTNPGWTAETAQALALAGDSTEAATVARRALELDEINRAAGHVDRYLPDNSLTDVKRIAAAK
ncbi:MAG: O-antigen ligase family protein [Planctomycetota bacterium]|nr:O-antigen ligase family protein [Planctomycetota bacterium]